MPDFSSLLSKPVADITKAKPMPEGTFQGLLLSHKFDEAKTPNDKENPVKPICRTAIRLTQAMDDVDQADLNDALQGKELSSIQPMDYDFWLTDNAQWRVIEFALQCGIPTEGASLGEIIQQIDGQPVIVNLIKVQSKKAGQENTFYTNIGSIIGASNPDAKFDGAKPE